MQYGAPTCTSRILGFAPEMTLERGPGLSSNPQPYALNCKPLLSEYGTYKIVKARIRPWLPSASPKNVSSSSILARKRAEEKGMGGGKVTFMNLHAVPKKQVSSEAKDLNLHTPLTSRSAYLLPLDLRAGASVLVRAHLCPRQSCLAQESNPQRARF